MPPARIPYMHSSRLFAASLAVAFVSGCADCGGGKTPPPSYGEVAVIYDVDGTQITSRDGTYDFGRVPMGTSKTLKVTVQNRGLRALDLDRVTKESGANVKLGDTLDELPAVFKLAFTRTTLGAGESVTYDLTFDAPLETDATVVTKDWESKVQLHVLNVAPGSEVSTLTFKGTAIAGSCVLPATIDFGAVMLDDQAKHVEPVRNTSPLDATATIGAITSNSGDDTAFGFAPESITGTVTIPAAGSRDLVFTFKPTDARDYLALVKARAAEACPELTIKLVGTGVSQVLACAPSPVDFGYVTPGLTVQRELMLQNLSNKAITVTNLATRIGSAPSSEYRLLGADTVTIPAAVRTNGALTAGAAPVQLTFTPANLGVRNGALVGATTLAKQPMFACPLRGVGGGPDIDLKPAALNFGRVPFFMNATTPFFVERKITIRNVGTDPNPPDVSAHLHLGRPNEPFRVTPKNGSSPLTDICVGVYDPVNYPAQPCRNELPASYNAQVGLRALATQFLDVPVRVQPSGVNLNQEWDVTFFSNDPDEPEVTVNVKAQSVDVPPCNAAITPTSLNFGLVTPPQYRELSFQIRNLGTNPNETCLITALDMKAGSDPVFSLPAGAIDQLELMPGEVKNVTVRAWPQGATTGQVQQVLGAVQFGISRINDPQQEISLSASIATACLTITPHDLDFGTVQKNCNSPRRTFSIYNTCTNPVTVISYGMLSAAGAPPGTMYCTGTTVCPEFHIDGTPSFGNGTQITSGSMPQTFAIRYKPLDDGADTGAFLLKVNQNGSVVDYVVTLRGKGDAFGLNTDVFRQDSRPKADILLVIDDSGSMSNKQMSLAANFSSFISFATQQNIDYHIGVTNTEMSGSTAAMAGYLHGTPTNPKVLTPTTPDVQNLFRQKVQVGTTGYDEGISCIAVKALTSPLVTNENAGFLRHDAVLAVVGVTDAPDQCPAAAVVYENQLRNIKGAQNPNMFSYNIIGPFLPQAPAGCTYDGPPQDPKHIYLTTALGGLREEICTQNWATALENLSKRAFGYRTNFFLTAEPDLTAGNQITITIDQGQGAEQVLPTDPRGAPVWHYDSVSNAVIFEPLFVPGAGAVMTVTYRVACL